MYRILTENRNRWQIETLCRDNLSGCTIFEATGLWHGRIEQSLVIEIALESLPVVKNLACKIGAVNGQEAVLVQEIASSEWLIPTNDSLATCLEKL